MSKFQITRACGHDEWVQIYGPNKDRDWKAQAESRRLCRDCYEAELKAKRAAEAVARIEAAKAAADEAEAGNLPTLTGSEKQITWAETIRKTHHDSLVAAAARAITPGIKALFDEEIGRYMAESSAHAWIERRHETPDARWLGKQLQARLPTEPAVAEAFSAAAIARRLMDANK